MAGILPGFFFASSTNNSKEPHATREPQLVMSARLVDYGGDQGLAQDNLDIIKDKNRHYFTLTQAKWVRLV
jgi:hypothetical protein